METSQLVQPAAESQHDDEQLLLDFFDGGPIGDGRLATKGEAARLANLYEELRIDAAGSRFIVPSTESAGPAFYLYLPLSSAKIIAGMFATSPCGAPIEYLAGVALWLCPINNRGYQ